ncbi:MAG: hypothetical protein AAF292_05780 [Pseudomonadota bacterium]
MDASNHHNTTDPTIAHRICSSVAFLATAFAVVTSTLFAVMDGIRPALEGADPSSAAMQALLAKLYPFEGAGEARMLYGTLFFAPILLPLLTKSKIAAWVTIVTAGLLTLVNAEDAISVFILDGKVVFGLAFLFLVSAPALTSIWFGVRWART